MKASGFFKGCALGCGGLILIGLMLMVGSLIGINSLGSRAVDLRESLESALPDQQSFVPRSDGTIPADRLERFLDVRRGLMTFCPEFTELAAGMEGMDDHVTELESNEEATAGDLLGLLGRVGGMGRGLLGVGRRVGEFSVARNEALLAQEMGLGEYTWIYVVAYYSWLGHEPATFALEEEKRPRIFHERILGDIREMLRRQLIELEAGPDEERLELLRLEVAAMTEDPLRLPFADGLPMDLQRSLEPFEEELGSAFCAATSELDFMRTEKGTLKYDHL